MHTTLADVMELQIKFLQIIFIQNIFWFMANEIVEIFLFTLSMELNQIDG